MGSRMFCSGLQQRLRGWRPYVNRSASCGAGRDAHGAYPDSLAISQNWSVAAQGSDVPVYAVPVTRCGPHSFCRVELLAEGCAAALRLKFSGMLHEVRITPQTDALQWRKEGGDIICKLAAPCTFTVEVNGRMYTPLTVFVEAPEQNIPRREDPNVLWFGPGLHRVSSLELHTGQTLYLASGAVLKAVQPGKEEAPTVAGDWPASPIIRILSGRRTARISRCLAVELLTFPNWNGMHAAHSVSPGAEE